MKRCQKKKKSKQVKIKKKSFHFLILSETPPPTAGRTSFCAGTQIKRISRHRRGVHVQSLFCPPRQRLVINYLLSLLQGKQRNAEQDMRQRERERVEQGQAAKGANTTLSQGRRLL